ncbi:unnamed protein product [Musa textilis]
MAKADESTNKFATNSHGGLEFMASTCQVSGPNQLIKVDADVFNSVHRLFFFFYLPEFWSKAQLLSLRLPPAFIHQAAPLHLQ